MSELSTFTPLERFRTSDYAAEHLKWSRSDASRAAIEAVLAYMVKTKTGAELIHLQGASEFAKELLKIAEPLVTKPKTDRSNIENAVKPKP